MRSGTCPKCQSTTILTASGADSQRLRVGWVDMVQLECLVCSDCGHVELYVPNGLPLRKVRKGCERYVSPEERRRKRRAARKRESGDSGGAGESGGEEPR